MRLKENATAEKLRGGYYTPERLADFIVNWGLTGKAINSILEPSCGDGVFLGSLINRYDNINFSCLAIELDSDEAQKANKLVKNRERFWVINEDFYKVYEQTLRNNTYDFIVGNPPYIRYQYLTEQQRQEQSLILTSNGMKSNKLINAWVSFVVACTQILDQNGRIGFVIPAELLQVAYAQDLRMYLMKQLQRITILTFRELIFPNVEQEVVVLLGEKDASHNREHQIRILEYRNIEDLIENFNNEEIPFQNIELNDSKWTRYFLTDAENQIIDEIKHDKRFIPFSYIADVDIGITTGNNNFFCVNAEIVEKYGLDNVVRPLIARSVSIRGIRFTPDDWKYNIQRGAKAFLLNFPPTPFEEYPEGHRRYINLGEVNNQHIGYKCSIRDRWYRVPSIWEPDAFFLRRNFLYPKFVLNTKVHAVSTDTMHRVKFLLGIKPERALLSYYNSIALAFTEIEGRSYGGGVLEILPGELEKITVPDLSNSEIIDDETVRYFVELIDDYVRNNEDILGLLEIIDEKLLVGILNIDRNYVLAFRRMWLTLRERRLGRGNYSI